MDKEKLGQEPAFPMDFELGMSKRFYAAIALKVPDSGEEWLDEMIRKANRRDAACAAMQGILSRVNIDYGKPNVGAGSMVDAIRRRDEFMKDAIDCSYRWTGELLKQENE